MKIREVYGIELGMRRDWPPIGGTSTAVTPVLGVEGKGAGHNAV